MVVGDEKNCLIFWIMTPCSQVSGYQYTVCIVTELSKQARSGCKASYFLYGGILFKSRSVRRVCCLRCYSPCPRDITGRHLNFVMAPSFGNFPIHCSPVIFKSNVTDSELVATPLTEAKRYIYIHRYRWTV
jgi:hypothetical protein